jgi:hypothetical protein
MSTDNVTPIRGDQTASALPPGFQRALEEQQTRVWRLRNLLDTLCIAVRDGWILDDGEAAIQGLVDYADGIHLALDVDLLKERGAEIAEERARKGKQP